MSERCRAKSKQSGEQCKRWASNNGLCYYHGGAPGTGVNPDNPVQIKHGRYSKCLPTKLKERYEYYKTDPNWLSLLNEVAVARSLFDEFIGRFEDSVLTSEHIEIIGGYLERIGRLTEKADKILNGDKFVLRVDQAHAMLARLSDICNTLVDSFCEDKDKARAYLAKELATLTGDTSSHTS